MPGEPGKFFSEGKWHIQVFGKNGQKTRPKNLWRILFPELLACNIGE
jgi:hypothetical protein